MMRREEISYELLRTLAAEAWDLGDMERAAELAACVDRAMLECLKPGERSKVGTDEVSLVMPADRA